MYCDRSALLLKSYKSHCKTIKNKHQLAVAFFAFWAIRLKVLKYMQKYRHASSVRKTTTN
jgi:hypothetical protein